MLAELEIHATIPASDLARAKKFYQEKLGLTPAGNIPGWGVVKWQVTALQSFAGRENKEREVVQQLREMLSRSQK
jgi:catechol 2,3-dioxygenase-like lactoylglutathione lyase family enzyme